MNSKVNKVLIIGGSGQIGFYLTKFLIKKNEIYISTRNKNSKKIKKLKNIFIKAKIKSILDDKVSSVEIKFYSLSKKTLHIKKSKWSKFSLDITGISDDILVRVLTKKIPDPNIINVSDFYKRELRSLKISNLIK